MIYADNAATTRLDEDAFEAMKPFLTEQYGNPSQPYAFARGPRKALRQARETIAACIGAEPEEIIFTSGGTESDNQAVKGTMNAFGWQGCVVTSAFEHHAVLNACAALARHGVPVRYLQPTSGGVIHPETLEKTAEAGTRLVSVMFANNELGTVQPIRELCETAHESGALFHTDAVQAAGHLPIDVHALGVDLLSASAHKFNGPKGVGFLFVRKGLQLRPHNDGGAQEGGLRAGTENTAGIVGMAAALKKNCDQMEETARRLSAMETELTETLQARGIRFLRSGAGEPHLPGLLSLSFPGFDGEALLHRLDLMGICAATGAACDSRETQISHVLKAIGLDETAARGTIRISFGRYNAPSDARTIAEALAKIIGQVPSSGRRK